jgi:hypothetical protein
MLTGTNYLLKEYDRGGLNEYELGVACRAYSIFRLDGMNSFSSYAFAIKAVDDPLFLPAYKLAALDSSGYGLQAFLRKA